MPAPILGVSTRRAKRALCIAVHYYDLPDYTLHNVHEDPRLVQEVLTDKFGYLKEDITVLMEKEGYTKPTRANILQAMKDLVAGAQPGDRFVCHISGHGSQIPNLNHTETDGFDEVFWPSDIEISWDKHHNLVVQNYIIDDIIKEILVDTLPPGANLVMIFDCCHSGSMADLPHVHSDHHKPKPKRENFKAERSKNYVDEESLLSPLSAFTPVSGPFEQLEVGRALPNVVAWSACRDAQMTYEHFRGGGQFVKFLCQTICKDPTQTHQQLLHRTHKRIEAHISRFNNLSNEHAGEKPVQIVAPPKPQLSTLGDYVTILKTSIVALF